jgi:hypothetical protein
VRALGAKLAGRHRACVPVKPVEASACVSRPMPRGHALEEGRRQKPLQPTGKGSERPSPRCARGLPCHAADGEGGNIAERSAGFGATRMGGESGWRAGGAAYVWCGFLPPQRQSWIRGEVAWRETGVGAIVCVSTSRQTSTNDNRSTHPRPSTRACVRKSRKKCATGRGSVRACVLVTVRLSGVAYHPRPYVQTR